MSRIEIRVPKFPACDEPCGACFNADDSLDVLVGDLFVAVGDKVEQGDLVALVETNKTSMEVEAPAAGTVLELRVRCADSVTEDAVLMVIAPED